MNVNCMWVEGVLAALILVFTIWPTLIFSATVSWWIVVISAALLIIHALTCHKCGGICAGMVKGKKRGKK